MTEIRTGIRLDGDARGMNAAMAAGEKAVRDLNQEIDRASQGSDRLANAIRLIGHYGTALVSATAAWNLAKQTVETADAMTMLQSRLKLVTSSSNELVYVQGRLFDIAQQSRVSYTELGATYAQIARATSALGISHDRLLVVTQSIGQAMAISGGSAQSMNAALVQLSQGLASGTLRGEELNSILEQTPRLAQAIADGMGVSLGQLRALGQDGKLTALNVVQALEKAGPGLKREFDQVAVTVGGAMTALGNSGARFVEAFDKASGSSAALARTIKGIGNVVDDLGATITKHKEAWGIFSSSAAWALGLGAVATILPRVAAGVALVGMTAAAHPVIAGLMAVGALGAAIYNGYQALTAIKPDPSAQAREEFMRFERNQQSREDNLAPFPGAKSLEEVRKYGKLVVDVQREAYDQSVQIAQSYQNRIKLATTEEERVMLTREMNARLIQVNKDAQREIKGINEQGAAEARQLSEAQFSQRKAGLELVASAERYSLAERGRSNEQFYKLGLVDVNDYYRRKSALEVEDINVSTRLVQAELEQARSIAATARRAEDKAAAQARVLGLEKELVELAGKRKAAIDLPRDQEQLYWRSQEMQAREEVARLRRQSMLDGYGMADQMDAQTRQWWAVGSVKDPNRQLRAQLDEEVRLRKEAIDKILDPDAKERATIAFNDWVVAKNLELTERLKPGYQKMLQEWADTTRLMRESYNQAMEGMLRTGEDEFARSGGNLVSMTRAIGVQIEQELLRVVYRKYLASTVANLGGSLFGGLSSALGLGDSGWGSGNGYGSQDLGQFLHGGGMVGQEATFRRAVDPRVFAGAPRFHTGGITGEEVPIVAKKGEGVFTPGQMRALGAGLGGPQINLSVVNNTGTPLSVRQRPGAGGVDLELVLDFVDAGLGDRMANGQGSLYHSTAGSFGLRRAVS